MDLLLQLLLRSAAVQPPLSAVADWHLWAVETKRMMNRAAGAATERREMGVPIRAFV
jgi:hypothetical protein